MATLKIGMRDDLSMPLGKEISQCAHALCSYELGCFDKAAGAFRVDEESLGKSIETFSIERMPLDLMEGADIIIQDAGHTVFNGVPTVTTCLFADDAKGFVKNAYEAGAPTDTRMALCVTKEFRRGLKGAFFHLAVSSYAKHLQSALKNRTGDKHLWMTQWMDGAFAKITLNATPEQMELIDKGGLSFPVTKVSDGMFVLGPAPKSELDPFTGGMRLL